MKSLDFVIYFNQFCQSKLIFRNKQNCWSAWDKHRNWIMQKWDWTETNNFYRSTLNKLIGCNVNGKSLSQAWNAILT